MKRMLLIAVALLCAACTELPDMLYKSLLFGDMQSSGVFRGDDGVTYTFGNLEDFKGFPSSGRLVVLLEAYEKGDADDRYFARIVNYAVPLCKEPVKDLSEEEEAALGPDPIRMDRAVISGGHINMQFSIMVKDGSDVKHEINLELLPSTPNDTLHMVLRHNAKGDRYDGSDPDSFNTYSYYACFPIRDAVKAGNYSAMEISWLWDETWTSSSTSVKQ